MTIKEAFEKLVDTTAAAMKNPFFVMRKLHSAFVDIADNIEGGGGGGSTVEVTQVLESGTKIATITVDDTPTDLYAPSGSECEDVSNKITLHTGITVAESFKIEAYKCGNIVMLIANGSITSGSAAAGTNFTFLDIDSTITPSINAYAFCYGANSTNRTVLAKTDSTIVANCGDWCSFQMFWFI